MARKSLLTLGVVLMSVASIKAQPDLPQGDGSATAREMYAQMMPPPNPYPPARSWFRPARSTVQPGYVAPHEDTVPDDAALINLWVPANAEVWLSGEKTASTGSERSFVTPSLEAGRRFAYDIRVRWIEKGKPVEKVKKVSVHPGDRLTLSIN
jgi:uncharacterized protein (TIGR03000 family)